MSKDDRATEKTRGVEKRRQSAAPPLSFFDLRAPSPHDEIMNDDLIWRHIVISARCTWLHGDSRGFPNRHHRIHSSGDYKNPPPQGEHSGLYRYHKNRSEPEVHIPFECRALIGRAIIEYF